MRLVALVALAGCDRVLGLAAPQPADAGDAAFFDAAPLFVPPDGSTACNPPPDFASWKFGAHSVAGVSTGSIIHPTFYAPDRVVFVIGNELWDSGLDGGAQQIAELGGGLAAPSAAPLGNVFWYESSIMGAGIDRARRTVSGWQPEPVVLVPEFALEVGSVGFYAGEARMVISAQTTTNQSDSHLLELASSDGLGWRVVGELPRPGMDVRDPAMSPDGCYVVFGFAMPTGAVVPYISARQADGTFATPAALALPLSCTAAAGFAIDPTQTRLWFVCAQTGSLFEGRPP